MYVIHEPLRIIPKCRVELHIHLDGAIRPETIWELMRKKKLDLPGDGSLEALKKYLIVKEPDNLMAFLKPFAMFLPAFKGDLETIERFSFEFVEDQSKHSVIYCEARFCPHLLLADSHSFDSEENKNGTSVANGSSIDVKQILEASLRGLRKGEEIYGTKINLILCCIRGKNDWSWEILKLCEKYQNTGVVGIDIAGNEDDAGEEHIMEEVTVFEAAKEKGIRRTIHAGEDGGWEFVKQAITVLGAERIGHGYRVLENEEFYQKCVQDGIHFEMCPHSSYLTGSIKGLKCASKRHPILRLAEDGASFSINSDDPTVTGTHVSEEYELLRSWGFNEALFVRANFEAASKSFLPPVEKRELILKLKKAYGIPKDIMSTTELPASNSSPSAVSSSFPSAVLKPSVKIASWEDRSF